MKGRRKIPRGKQYFENVASKWDGMRSNFFSDAVRDKAIYSARVKPGKIAADIGAGTGFITDGLIRKGLKVIAVDSSKAMIKEMRAKFGNVKSVEFRIGEAESLPIKNESVDYVFANMFLHHAEKPLAAIKEMVRVLKPKGKLVITDLDKHNFKFLKTEHRDRWPGFKRESVEIWLSKAGVKGIRVGCIGENCRAKSDNGNNYASISIFIALGIKK